jgi:hypothetical protein
MKVRRSCARCIEGGERVLMLVALALRRHLRDPYGHVRPEEASLSIRHRIPHRFDVAAVGVGAGGSMVLRQPCRYRPPLGGHELLRRRVSNDATIALCFAVAFSASASIGSSTRNSLSSESSSSSSCGGAGSCGGGGGGGGGAAGGAPEPPRGSMA